MTICTKKIVSVYILGVCLLVITVFAANQHRKTNYTNGTVNDFKWPMAGITTVIYGDYTDVIVQSSKGTAGVTAYVNGILYDIHNKEMTFDEFDKYILSDCPLDPELQKFIFETCKQENIDYYLEMALIQVESNYETDIISESNDYGLMQINKINHKDGRDYLDPETNITEGSVILGDLLNKYDTLEMALMAYNMGETKASELWAQGIYSSEYSRHIIAVYSDLKSSEIRKVSLDKLIESEVEE